MTKRLYLALALLATACAKTNDPTPPVQPPAAQPTTPAATGTYTDPSGVDFALTALSAKVVAAAANPTTGAAQQSIVITGTLPDARLVRVGYTVVQSGFASAPGPIANGSLPYIAGPYAAGTTVSGYSHSSYTSGAIALEAVGPVLLSGSFRGPLLTTSPPANPPTAKVVFAHVTVTP